jgi:hypothetical protein
MEELDLQEVKADIRKILLIGQEGSGKTHFIGTMPKPIYLFSFDKGYLTLAGEDGIKVGVCMDDNRYSPHAYADFKTKFDAIKKGDMYTWKDGRKEKYRTIAIDSLSFLGTFLYDHEQRMNNSIDKQGGFGVWGNVKSKMQDIVNQSVMLAEYVVCTALLEATKDDLTGEIFYVPSIPGSMKNEIGAWFDAVFYMALDKKATTGEKEYKMLTVGDRRQKAKVRLPRSLQNALSAVEVPDFNLLMKKIGNVPDQHATIQQTETK